jgi:hypothetical protein
MLGTKKVRNQKPTIDKPNQNQNKSFFSLVKKIGKEKANKTENI